MKSFLSLLAWCGLLTAAHAQTADSSNRYEYLLELRTNATSNDQVPFWLRTNQYGSRPPAGASGSMILAARHRYRSDSISNKLDWKMNFEGRLNVGRENEFQVIEANLGLRWNIFEMKLGRSRDLIGIMDSTLSTGAYSVSGNARGVPKIEISIPQYWSLGFTKNWLALKGNFNFGYMGNYDLNRRPYITSGRSVAFLHQKSLYLRLGKPGGKLSLSGGFNHNVQFGAEQRYFSGWGLSSGKTLLYVVTGQAFDFSKVGNHLGSIDQAIDYDFDKVHIMAYHQFFYEVGGLAHLNNLKDGLWGVSIRNKERNKNWGWSKFLVEALTSKSQGGELDAKVTPSGDEDYYNNYLYREGWSYQGENLGNNLLTNKRYQRQDLPGRVTEYFGNNRVYALHLGAEGYAGAWTGTAKVTLSKNFGSYATSPEGNTTGGVRSIGKPPYFPAVSQFSGYLELNRTLTKPGLDIGAAVAVDHGELLYNSIGGFIRVSKKL